jgi:hypothetical protein
LFLLLHLLHGNLHTLGQILHHRDLPNPVLERLPSEDDSEELRGILEAGVRFCRLFAIFVVGCAQLFVAEDLVGFADGLEFGVGVGVVGVFVYTL